MNEIVDGYSLSQNELDLELGRGANTTEMKKQADLISNTWSFPGVLPPNPVLLLVGGFQGSGKTTVLELLQSDPGMIVISSDEIRHNLFSQEHPFSDDFVRLVNATKFELMIRATETGHIIAVDQGLTPDRVTIAKKMLEPDSKYSVLSIFLSAPKDVLTERVSERRQLAGRYRGKVEELEASMERYEERYGRLKASDYDLTIDTNGNSPEEIAALIREKISK